jgi:hypothetical protein
MIWLAIAVGGMLGSTARHGGTMVVDRFGVGCRQLWDQRVDGFVAGMLVGLVSTAHLAMIESVHTAASLSLLAAFTTCSTLGSTGVVIEGRLRHTTVSRLARQIGLGIIAAIAGWLVGSQP